jgi:hypothetical protein
MGGECIYRAYNLFCLHQARSKNEPLYFKPWPVNEVQLNCGIALRSLEDRHETLTAFFVVVAEKDARMLTGLRPAALECVATIRM